MKFLIKTLTFLIIIILISTVGFWLYKSHLLNKKANYSEELIFEIPNGTSIYGAVKILNSKGVLEPEIFFKYYVYYFARINNLKLPAGKFKIAANKSNEEIIQSLFDKSNLWTVNVTFPEALSYKDFARIASAKVKCSEEEFLRLCTSDSLLTARKIKANSLEGYLMPDTYQFFIESPAARVIDVMLDNHFKIIKSLENEIKSSNLSHHGILTLASIIEAETPVDDEKPIVSGLYHNRLRDNWLLQADPTVQYAIGKKKKLTYDDLKFPHAYNTYVKVGLPPGPINNPGKASIKAALFPAKHDFMYMVAIGDGSGKHNFASTFNGHQQNIRIFKKNIK